MPNIWVGADIGGTFTDVVMLSSDGRMVSRKIASTPDDYSRAVLDGASEICTENGLAMSEIVSFNHAHTIATNTILEEKGASTVLVTTRGFRDILELRRLRVPRLYDMRYKKPAPLIERRYRLEANERVAAGGEVITPLTAGEVDRIAERIAEIAPASVVICLLHSYANPQHESAIAEAVKKRCPNLAITLSSELLPMIKEYERTSTAVINAYVRPAVEAYLGRLESGLAARGAPPSLSVMQSNGGLCTPAVAATKPVYCIESGPAAGVMGALQIGRKIDMPNLMTLDMGGTTAKASLIEDGQPLRSQEYEVGAGLNIGHRLLRGAGHIVCVPTIDIAEVGAGGGSIARVDAAGVLHVGPDSAGAVPGPACYGRGGSRATVTDANVVLGYLHPNYLLGGAFPISVAKAATVIEADVARPLGLSPIEAAYGLHILANSNMSRALRAVTSERGRDPRGFTLCAFGGGGPLHAAGLAEMLGVGTIVVPPSPGVFSAFGLLFSDVEHHLLHTFCRRLGDEADPDVEQVVSSMRREAATLLTRERLPPEDQRIEVSLGLRYEGQGAELSVRLRDHVLTPQAIVNAKADFAAEHLNTFGHNAELPIELVSIRTVGRGLKRNVESDEISTPPDLAGAGGSRNVYFGSEQGWRTTDVVGRAQLCGQVRHGPLLVEEYDSTCVIPPGWDVTTDSWQNLVLRRSGSENEQG